METFEPCPTCSSNDDLVIIKRQPKHRRRDLFMILCRHCGFGTSNAYASLGTLKAIWNALVLDKC